MWIYSLLASFLPGGEPTPMPPQPSAENPTPFKYPAFDDNSKEHNPYSFTENRAVGTYLTKRAVMTDIGDQQETDRRAMLKIQDKMRQRQEQRPPTGTHHQQSSPSASPGRS